MVEVEYTGSTTTLKGVTVSTTYKNEVETFPTQCLAPLGLPRLKSAVNFPHASDTKSADVVTLIDAEGPKPSWFPSTSSLRREFH